MSKVTKFVVERVLLKNMFKVTKFVDKRALLGKKAKTSVRLFVITHWANFHRDEQIKKSPYSVYREGGGGGGGGGGETEKRTLSISGILIYKAIKHIIGIQIEEKESSSFYPGK